MRRFYSINEGRIKIEHSIDERVKEISEMVSCISYG